MWSPLHVRDLLTAGGTRTAAAKRLRLNEESRMTLRCDLIIRDATVFDGLGGPRFRAISVSLATASPPWAISARRGGSGD